MTALSCRWGSFSRAASLRAIQAGREPLQRLKNGEPDENAHEARGNCTARSRVGHPGHRRGLSAVCRFRIICCNRTHVRLLRGLHGRRDCHQHRPLGLSAGNGLRGNRPPGGRRNLVAAENGPLAPLEETVARQVMAKVGGGYFLPPITTGGGDASALQGCSFSRSGKRLNAAIHREAEGLAGGMKLDCSGGWNCLLRCNRPVERPTDLNDHAQGVIC